MELMAFQRAGPEARTCVMHRLLSVAYPSETKRPQLMVDSIRPLTDAEAPGAVPPPKADRKLWCGLTERDPILHRLS